MRSRMTLFGYRIHPMLVTFPLALLSTSVAFDVVHRLRVAGWLVDRPYNGWWAVLAYWLIAIGLVGGVIAAVTGAVDWLALPSGTRAKSLGVWHGTGNAVVLTLFGVSWLLRRDAPHKPSEFEFALSLLGLGLVLLTGWLGLEMVGRLSGSPPPVLDAPGPLLDFVFERHPTYAGQRVQEVWADLTSEAATAQTEFVRLSGEAEGTGETAGSVAARSQAAEQMERIGERWAPFAGATWSTQPPRQVAAARILWEYFSEQHPGGTMQMYDVWLADSELRRRGPGGFPRRAAATCGLLMLLSLLWGCGIATVLVAILR